MRYMTKDTAQIVLDFIQENVGVVAYFCVAAIKFLFGNIGW